MRLRPSNALHFPQSIGRPNIHLACRNMKEPCSSYRDLAFLFPNGSQEFLKRRQVFFSIFFESTAECEDVIKYL
jgi:hypothetical protein